MGMMKKMVLMKAMAGPMDEEKSPMEKYETSEKNETYSAPSSDPGDRIRAFKKKQQFKKTMLDQGKGKYSAPVRYAIRKTVKNIGGKIEDVTENVKKGFQRNQAEKDASGKRPGRNSSVGVCTAGGKCQQ